MRFNNLVLQVTIISFSCGQGERLNSNTELERKIKERVTSVQKILDFVIRKSSLHWGQRNGLTFLVLITQALRVDFVQRCHIRKAFIGDEAEMRSNLGVPLLVLNIHEAV